MQRNCTVHKYDRNTKNSIKYVLSAGFYTIKRIFIHFNYKASACDFTQFLHVHLDIDNNISAIFCLAKVMLERC